MEKYENWSKVLIEPSVMNDARLYAVETRLHQEEDIRIREYEYVRDLLKKLLYSFEQKDHNPIEIIQNEIATMDERHHQVFNTIPGIADSAGTPQPNMH